MSDNTQANELWQAWFDMKAAARTKKWDVVQTMLAENTEQQMTAHPFLAEVFHSAANAGQANIVKTLFTRGFSLDAETRAETLKRLATYYHSDAAAVMSFLIKEQSTDSSDAVCWAAAHGRLDVLQTLENSGADVLSGASSFHLALYGGHPEVMHYLHEKQADLYHPALIAAGYGRRQELPTGQADTTIQVYRDLLTQENDHWAICYAEAGGAQKTLSQFRCVPNELGRAPMSYLHLAVRAGKFSDVVSVALHEKQNPLRAEDFLVEDYKGVSALMVMTARGELDAVFDPKLWQGRSEEILKLHDGLKKYKAEKALDLQAFSAEITRYGLRQKRNNASRLSLRPGPGR